MKNIKLAKYERIKKQLEPLFLKTSDPLARMTTAVAVLHHKFDYFFWTGFYRLVEGELTVTTYQGSLACLVLAKHTGVCWSAIDKKETVLMANVHDFPGHIACDSRSQSEVVVPVRDQSGDIVAVLDVDSSELNSFDQDDARGLESIVEMIYTM